MTDAMHGTWMALNGRDRIETIDFVALLEYALERAHELAVGTVFTAEHLIDPWLWEYTRSGVHSYLGRVISYMVERGLLPVDPIESGGGTRFYRRTP